MRLELTQEEVRRAALVGVQRHVENLYAGRADTHALRSDGWGEHITGAIGELAVARALGIEWTRQTFRTRHDGDAGGHEVRATIYDAGALILHPDDPDHRYFYLVTGRPPIVDVRGWILGSNGKQRQWWDTKRTRAGAYMVPQEALIKLKAEQPA